MNEDRRLFLLTVRCLWRGGGKFWEKISLFSCDFIQLPSILCWRSIKMETGISNLNRGCYCCYKMICVRITPRHSLILNIQIWRMTCSHTQMEHLLFNIAWTMHRRRRCAVTGEIAIVIAVARLSPSNWWWRQRFGTALKLVWRRDCNRGHGNGSCLFRCSGENCVWRLFIANYNNKHFEYVASILCSSARFVCG